MNKETYKKINHANRLAVHKAVNSGLAVSMKQAASFALLAMIHAEIAPKIQAMRDAESYCSNGHKQENQDFVFDLQKYRDSFAIGHRVQSTSGQISDLAIENNPFASIEKSKDIEPQSLAEQRG